MSLLPSIPPSLTSLKVLVRRVEDHLFRPFVIQEKAIIPPHFPSCHREGRTEGGRAGGRFGSLDVPRHRCTRLRKDKKGRGGGGGARRWVQKGLGGCGWAWVCIHVRRIAPYQVVDLSQSYTTPNPSAPHSPPPPYTCQGQRKAKGGAHRAIQLLWVVQCETYHSRSGYLPTPSVPFLPLLVFTCATPSRASMKVMTHRGVRCRRTIAQAVFCG
jgi:hypothetical protein